MYFLRRKQEIRQVLLYGASKSNFLRRKSKYTKLRGSMKSQDFNERPPAWKITPKQFTSLIWVKIFWPFAKVT